MDFDAASQSHFEWKSKLRKYLAKPDGSLTPGSIERDNECALGKWIRGEVGKLNADPAFKELKEKHTRFHKSAADLVRRADSGEKVNAETNLGTASPFNQLSLEITTLIREMKLKSSEPAVR